VVRNGQSQLNLDSCPPGHVFTTNNDGCVVCGAGFYSLGVGKAGISCLTCPAGGNCLAGGPKTLNPNLLEPSLGR